MAQQPSLLPLKIIVISLGVLLVGGTIVLFATIASKAGKDVAGAHCTKDATLKLNVKGKTNISSITPVGDTVQISLTTEKDIEVLTVDRCSGKLLQTLSITP